MVLSRNGEPVGMLKGGINSVLGILKGAAQLMTALDSAAMKQLSTTGEGCGEATRETENSIAQVDNQSKNSGVK